MDILRFEESGSFPNAPTGYKAEGFNKQEPTNEELAAAERGEIDTWFLEPNNIAWALDGLGEEEEFKKLYNFLNYTEVHGGIAMRVDVDSDRDAFLAIDNFSEAELDLLKAGCEAMEMISTGDYEHENLEEDDKPKSRTKRMLGGTAMGAIGVLTPLMTAFPYWAQTGMYGLGVMGASVVGHGAYQWVKDIKAKRQLEDERDMKAEACLGIFEKLSQKFDSEAVVVLNQNFNINLEALRKSDDLAISEFHGVIEAHQDSVTNVSKDIVDVALQSMLGDKHEVVKRKKRKKIKNLQFNPFSQLNSMLEGVARLDESMVSQVWTDGIVGANIEPLKQVVSDISSAHERLVDHALKVKVVRGIDGSDKDDSVTLNNLGTIQVDLQKNFAIAVLRFLRCRQDVMRYLSRDHGSDQQWPLLDKPDGQPAGVQ